jgi:hypothetical protein
MGTRQLVLDALDKGFQDGVSGLYSSVIANVAGGDKLEVVLKRFDAGFVAEVCEEHDRIVAEAVRLMDERGVK